ncbi:MAG: energy transducer TonB [Prevotellaceae bacterium]|jgi:protein TonB|nr:energy transducer TonB [Prevotellaceae bacterium]
MSNYKNIFAYLAGRLSGKQANRLERQAVDEPFLYEAIEGFEENKGAHEQNLQKLHRKLKVRTQTAKPRYHWHFQDAAIFIVFISVLGFLLVPRLNERRVPTYYADLMKITVEEEFIFMPSEPRQHSSELLSATPVAPIVSDIIVIVDDEVALSDVFFDVQVETMEVDVSAYIAQGLIVAEEAVEEEIIPYVAVEQKPKFIISGKDVGKKGFSRWIAQQIRYPEAAIEQELRGRVLCSFVITAEGNVTDVKVLSGVHPLLDKEAIRVISSSPQWIPGMERGRAVAVAYYVPVVFLLS